MHNTHRWIIQWATRPLIIGFICLGIWPIEALASWGILDNALDRILALLTGTPAKIIAGITVVIAGYKLIFAPPLRPAYIASLVIGMCAVFGGRQLVGYLGFL